MKRLILLTTILFSCVAVAFGDEQPQEMRDSVKLFFRQGMSSLDAGYMGNEETLRAFSNKVNAYMRDTAAHFRRIRIVASASPEGGMRQNEILAQKRAKAIVSHLSQLLAVDLGYEVEATGIDWDALIALVESEENTPHRDEVLDLLRSTPDDEVRDGRLVSIRRSRLAALHGGEPYRWMLEHLFPRLRFASARVEC
ncbi:MAG: hypothetical protein Q4A18_07845, partial [Rikenellaceae bacterium]|nr:hypothetical protein [Rikenellaceae bacterium]